MQLKEDRSTGERDWPRGFSLITRTSWLCTIQMTTVISLIWAVWMNTLCAFKCWPSDKDERVAVDQAHSCGWHYCVSTVRDWWRSQASVFVSPFSWGWSCSFSILSSCGGRTRLKKPSWGGEKSSWDIPSKQPLSVCMVQNYQNFQHWYKYHWSNFKH